MRRIYVRAWMPYLGAYRDIGVLYADLTETLKAIKEAAGKRHVTVTALDTDRTVEVSIGA